MILLCLFRCSLYFTLHYVAHFLCLVALVTALIRIRYYKQIDQDIRNESLPWLMEGISLWLSITNQLKD
ncbi:hypothetical protein VNO80_04809 [Phaseolus coccineus]|uniref:Uncharacterized protein n=1 Tax=Phaseolus coccineus TaxID=3886 RepID=A0AAN9NUD2_PHACN